MATVIDKNLGTESGFSAELQPEQVNTNIELGYSCDEGYHQHGLLPKDRLQPDAVADTYRRTGTWFYAMLNISPGLFLYQTGCNQAVISATAAKKQVIRMKK